MAEEGRDKDSRRTEIETGKKEAAVSFKNATESFMNLDGLIRTATGPSMEAFPSFGGWINSKIFNAVKDEKRVCGKRMKEVQKNHNLEPGECLSDFFRKFEESFRETNKKSENRVSGGELKGMKEIKDRAVDIGIELTRDLIEFLILSVPPGGQDEEHIQLRNWILWRSGREDSEVFILIDCLLNTAEELARGNINTKAVKTTEQDQASEDGKTEKENHLAAAILGLQSLVSNLQSETGSPMRIKLVELNHRINRCNEHLRVVKAGTKYMKEAWREKMEIRINRYWNDTFWRYISAVSLLRTRFGYRHGVYALCKLFVLDLSSSISANEEV